MTRSRRSLRRSRTLGSSRPPTDDAAAAGHSHLPPVGVGSPICGTSAFDVVGTREGHRVTWRGHCPHGRQMPLGHLVASVVWGKPKVASEIGCGAHSGPKGRSVTSFAFPSYCYAPTVDSTCWQGNRRSSRDFRISRVYTKAFDPPRIGRNPGYRPVAAAGLPNVLFLKWMESWQDQKPENCEPI